MILHQPKKGASQLCIPCIDPHFGLYCRLRIPVAVSIIVSQTYASAGHALRAEHLACPTHGGQCILWVPLPAQSMHNQCTINTFCGCPCPHNQCTINAQSIHPVGAPARTINAQSIHPVGAPARTINAQSMHNQCILWVPLPAHLTDVLACTLTRTQHCLAHHDFPLPCAPLAN